MNALEQIQAMYDRIERKLIDRGRKEGHEEGVKKGKAGALLQLLERRFGTLPKNVTARVTRASIEDIDRWFDRAVDAATLDDVFGR
jgi:flagellar biosynthesis/type III secretory pathway protein FliH